MGVQCEGWRRPECLEIAQNCSKLLKIAQKALFTRFTEVKGRPCFHSWSRLRGNEAHTPDPDLESFKTSLDMLSQRRKVALVRSCRLAPSSAQRGAARCFEWETRTRGQTIQQRSTQAQHAHVLPAFKIGVLSLAGARAPPSSPALGYQ
eukprot:scaffold93028_cov39-Phaeocystis_antarctica.AAC.1